MASHRRRIEKGSWVLLDQAASSASNLLLSVGIATSVAIETFGAFAVAFSVYWLCLGAMRALALEPLLQNTNADRQAALSDTLRLHSSLALKLGLGSCLVALALPAPLQFAVLSMAVGLPALLFSDALRYVAFYGGRGAVAAAIDVTWLVLQVASFVVLKYHGVDDLAAFIVAWTVAGAIGGGVGFVCLQPTAFFRPKMRDRPSKFGVQLLGEFAIGSGVQQVVALAVPIAAGLAEAGVLRGAQTLTAPLWVGMTSLSVVMMPALARLYAAGQTKQLTKICKVVSTVGFSLGVLAALILLVVPDHLGREILGASWDGASTVAPIIALQIGFIGINMGAMWGMRAVRRVDASLKLRLVLAPLTLALGIGGAAVDGAMGAAVGLGTSSFCASVAWWLLFRRVSKQIAD